MRRTALALITASILSVAACGGDDTTSTAGGSGTGGTTGSGGGKGGAAGTSGTSGTGGTSGSGGTSGGSAGSGGGGQAGKAGGDASTGTDVRPDTPTGTPDATADRTTDATTDGSAPGDAADGPAADTSSPPDGGTSDTAPPMDGASDARSDAPSDGATTMVLTSSAFTEGMTIPPAHTCELTNVSPALSWTAGPSGTLSYAIVFTDKNNGLVHSGIYDIPANVMSLPMNVAKVAMPSDPAGSKQVLAYSNMPGYAGPCPGPTEHTYEFMLYAVDIAALPGIATTQKGAALVTALQAHDIVTTTLTGKAKTP